MSDTSDIVERLRDCPSYPVCRTLHAEITALRDRLEKAEGALRECQSAIGDWSRPTGANGMTTPAEDHPLLWAMGIARAYFATQEPTP